MKVKQMTEIKLSQWAKQNNISYNAAHKRFLRGQIPNSRQTETGSIFVEEEDTSWKDDLIARRKAH